MRLSVNEMHNMIVYLPSMILFGVVCHTPFFSENTHIMASSQQRTTIKNWWLTTDDRWFLHQPPPPSAVASTPWGKNRVRPREVSWSMKGWWGMGTCQLGDWWFTAIGLVMFDSDDDQVMVHGKQPLQLPWVSFSQLWTTSCLLGAQGPSCVTSSGCHCSTKELLGFRSKLRLVSSLAVCSLHNLRCSLVEQRPAV